MRRFVSYSILLLLFLVTACAPSGNAGNCSNGLCVKVRSVGPIKKNQSVPIVIKVKADKDSSDVSISMSVDPGVMIEDVTEKTGNTHKDKVLVAWKKNLNAGEENTITQNVRFDQTGTYGISVTAHRSDAVSSDGTNFVITENGGTEILPGTPIPLVNPAYASSPTPGPSPTFPPTYTPSPVPTAAPSPTMTLPAYP